MDNDNKVTGRSRKTTLPQTVDHTAEDHRTQVLLFLKDELRPLSHDKPQAYNLETEYAKTRKNKNTFIWILMAVCFVVVGLVTYGISRFVDYQNDHLSVSIDVFNDLNLRNLLDIVSQTKEQHESALREKSRLEAEFTYAKTQAQQKRDADLFTLQSMKLGKAETNKRTAAIWEEYNKTIRSLHDMYDVKISTQENLAKQYQAQLAEYDSGKVEQAQQQEAAIDSTKQLYEIERKQTSEKYEKQLQEIRSQLTSQQQQSFENQKNAVKEVTVKYQKEIDTLDPVVAGKNDLLARAANSADHDSYEGSVIASQLAKNASSEYRAKLATISSAFDDFSSAQKIVSSVPQKNSIPSFVKAMSRFAFSSVNGLLSASVTEINRLSAQNDAYLAQVDEVKKEKEQAIQKLTEENAQAMQKLTAEKDQAVQAVTAEKNEAVGQNAVYQTYMEKLCADNACDGFVISVPSAGKIPVYISSAVRTYFNSPYYAGLVVTGTVKRKNAVLAAVTITEQKGVFYCSSADAASLSRIASGDALIVDKPQASSQPSVQQSSTAVEK